MSTPEEICPTNYKEMSPLPENTLISGDNCNRISPVGKKITFSLLPTLIVFFCFSALSFLFPLQACSDEILILMSGSHPAYIEATRGIMSALNTEKGTDGPKTVLQHNITELVLQNSGNNNYWKQTIINYRPNMIIAVGKRALKIATELKDIPIVHVMVPGSNRLHNTSDTISGVSLEVPPLTSLQKLHKTFPHIKKILVPFSPGYSNEFITKAKEAAKLLHITLTTVPIDSSREVLTFLSSWKKKTDAIWMIPDPTILTRQTVPAFLQFSISNRAILLTFAKKYMKTGAGFAVSADIFDMGREAGTMALDILRKNGQTDYSLQAPRSIRTYYNRELLKKLATLPTKTDNLF